MKQLLSTMTNSNRRRHYQQLIIIECIMIILVLVIYEVFSNYKGGKLVLIFLPCFGMIGILLSFYMWKMITLFTNNPLIKYGTMLCLFNRFLSVFVLLSPLSAEWTELQKSTLDAFSLTLALTGMGIMLYFMIVDIFKDTHEITYRLWGAGCIYIMIGSFFGNIFYLIDILHPGALGVVSDTVIPKVMQAMTHSMYVLSGMDSRFDQITPIIRNVSVLESIAVNLYLVLLVGRMLSK